MRHTRPALSTWLRLLKTHNLILREIRSSMTARGTTLPRFDVLAQLHRAPGGLTPRMLARRLLEQLDDGNTLADSYPYPVQVWKLGDDQLWISLAGEVCVEYSLRFKAIYGPHTWTAGFVNDLVCYVPSERILEEGGGQEPGSLWGYGLPAHDWAPGVEDRIVTAVEHRVKQLK